MFTHVFLFPLSSLFQPAKPKKANPMTTTTLDVSRETINQILAAMQNPALVTAAKNEHTSRLEAEATAQRDMTLSQLDRAYARQQAAQAALDEAAAALQAARADAERLAPAVAIASDELRQASAAVQTAYGHLRRHGGAVVAAGLHRLHAAAEHALTKLQALEANRFNVTMNADGTTPVWRTLKPEIDAQIAPARQTLQELQTAHAALQKLDAARGRSPESLRQEVLATLRRFGLQVDDLDPNAADQG